MLIHELPFGRLGNQLFVLANLLGTAIEHRLRLTAPSFRRYRQHFAAWEFNPACRYPLRRSGPWQAKYETDILYHIYHETAELLQKFHPHSRWHEVVQAGCEESYDLSSPDFLEAARSKTVFVRGWKLRHPFALSKHHAQLRELLMPRADYCQHADAVVQAAHRRCETLVGVHIRQTDYRDFRDGEWYFSPAQFRTVLEKVLETNSRGKLGFLLCSDEPLDLDEFGSLPVFASTGQFIEDLFALSECDFVLGPQSTFSSWASYFGQKPLLFLRSLEQDFDFSRFQVIANEGTFAQPRALAA